MGTHNLVAGDHLNITPTSKTIRIRVAATAAVALISLALTTCFITDSHPVNMNRDSGIAR
jgi:hypothetical protein